MQVEVIGKLHLAPISIRKTDDKALGVAPVELLESGIVCTLICCYLCDAVNGCTGKLVPFRVECGEHDQFVSVFVVHDHPVLRVDDFKAVCE